ncbi:MAG TPA: FecR domain-containing protein [Chitinophagaceae bacterium]
MDEQKLNSAFETSALIAKYLKGELSPEEQIQLDTWIETSEENRKLFSELTNPTQVTSLLNEFYSYNARKRAAYRQVEQRIFPQKKIFGIISVKLLTRSAVAAAVLGVVATGIYFTGKLMGALSLSSDKQQAAAILPGDGNPVMLTLSDGSKIPIDSLAAGVLANQGNTKILRQANGQLVYQSQKGANDIVSTNVVETPKGKLQEIVLPDGSSVWINALSRLEFPTAFNGKERIVALSGEAFFNVTNDKLRPFIIKINGVDVEVTGTQFNISAYSNEAIIRSTLIEGGIRILKDKVVNELLPGEQLQLNMRSGKIDLVKNADLDGVMSWKNGVFYLNNLDVASLMQQAERWYDIEVDYPAGVPDVRLFGEIDRNTSLLELLEVLTETGIRTRLRGKTLLIFP